MSLREYTLTLLEFLLCCSWSRFWKKKKGVHKENVLHQLDITRLEVLVAYIIREVK